MRNKKIDYKCVVDKFCGVKRKKLRYKAIAPLLDYTEYKTYDVYNFVAKNIAYDMFETKELCQNTYLSDCTIKINIYNLTNYADDVFLLRSCTNVVEYYDVSSVIYIVNDTFALSYKQTKIKNCTVKVIKRIQDELDLEYISMLHNKTKKI